MISYLDSQDIADAFVPLEAGDASSDVGDQDNNADNEYEVLSDRRLFGFAGVRNIMQPSSSVSVLMFS
jgi:hypothetical protein